MMAANGGEMNVDGTEVEAIRDAHRECPLCHYSLDGFCSIARLLARIEGLEAERGCLMEVTYTAYRWAKSGIGTFYDALAELQHYAHPEDPNDEGVNVEALRALQARYRADMNGT
jgi:hypothetical protein